MQHLMSNNRILVNITPRKIENDPGMEELGLENHNVNTHLRPTANLTKRQIYKQIFFNLLSLYTENKTKETKRRVYQSSSPPTSAPTKTPSESKRKTKTKPLQ